MSPFTCSVPSLMMVGPVCRSQPAMNTLPCIDLMSVPEPVVMRASDAQIWLLTNR